MRHFLLAALYLLCFLPAAEAAESPMILIRGGVFSMGSPEGEISRGGDELQRQVTLRDYRLGKFEVTQREFAEVMGFNPSAFKGENLPVENVTW